MLMRCVHPMGPDSYCPVAAIVVYRGMSLCFQHYLQAKTNEPPAPKADLRP